MKQAVIDIGTNTCLLLIADSVRVGEIQILHDVHNITRLGAGVDKTKHIQRESYERLKTILKEYKKILIENSVGPVAIIGTSALRDASNRDVIISKVKEECVFEIELLSGTDESLFSYRGAMCGLQSHELQGIVAALDIGGGSTELSIGENGKYLHGKSINIGAVRIKERFLSKINEESVESARECIRSEFKKAFDSTIQNHRLIAVAGTPTALAAMKLQLQIFDARKVNGTVLTIEEIDGLVKELFILSDRQLIHKYPAVHPSRADILPSGALILQEILKYLNLKKVRVSSYGLRYGIMIREFERRMNVENIEWNVTMT